MCKVVNSINYLSNPHFTSLKTMLKYWLTSIVLGSLLLIPLGCASVRVNQAETYYQDNPINVVSPSLK